jgi:hypothetical protein
MSVRLRLGPFRISSRGRVGVRVGPVSVSGGGHRRKRSSAGNTRASSQAAFERRTAKDQVWFRKQAAAERRAAKSDRNRPHDHDSDLANEYYERCVVELKKWKDSNAALLRRTQFTLHERYRENGMPTEKRWAAFTVSVQNTVKALDNVISAASAAKDAEERAFRSHYKFHGSNKRLRESRQLWNERIRQYEANRVNISKTMPNDEVPNSKSSLLFNRP